MLKIQSNSNKFFLKLSAILLFLLCQPTSITFAQKTVNYIYDSSGQRIQSVSGGVTTTYPSKYYNIDSNGKVTKLNYLNARYYDSNRGQFISQDPVFWEIGQTKDGRKALLNPQTQNSYSYAGNNPVTYKDPD